MVEIDMSFSDEAKNRIELSKAAVDIVRHNAGLDKEDWRVFTHKDDKLNPDPKRFKVHRVQEKTIKFTFKPHYIPKECLFLLDFDEKSKTVKVSEMHKRLSFLDENDVVMVDSIKDFKNPDYNIDLKGWTMVFN